MWEHFALNVQNVSPIWRTDEGELGPIDWTREKVTAKAVSMLLKLGFVHSYETIAHIAGVLPLLKRLRYDLHDLWPVSSEAIRGLLKHTTLWERLRESVAVTKLLKAAVKASDVELTDVLLENGVSVHQRISECSALEVACLNPAEGSDAKHIFTLLLDRAEPLHLDEINPCPDRGLGLIHYLVGREKEWQLDELLKRGIDVNLRISIDNGGGPAVVWHLWERSLKSAMTLLDRGANPTMADNDGVDTALAAAAQGGLDILVRLRTNLRQNWQVKWRQTCIIFIEGTGNFDLSVSGADALHLAAWQGHCDVLGFYIDNGLLTDLDAASVELFTPMHLAAFQGEIDMVRLLYSKGGHLNLKSADGSLPLHLAVRNEHSEVVEFLVENGSVMGPDIHGLTPVGYAMQLQNQSILEYFRATKGHLYYQSKPRRRERDLVYAYEQALIRGHVKQCERLRKEGCAVNVDLAGQNGRTALVLAIENSKEELIKWLLDHGARATCQMLSASRTLPSPVHTMMRRPALSDFLPPLLREYYDEGGSITHEVPSLICAAILHSNNLGLKLLLDHIARHETTNQ